MCAHLSSNKFWPANAEFSSKHWEDLTNRHWGLVVTIQDGEISVPTQTLYVWLCVSFNSPKVPQSGYILPVEIDVVKNQSINQFYCAQAMNDGGCKDSGASAFTSRGGSEQLAPCNADNSMFAFWRTFPCARNELSYCTQNFSFPTCLYPCPDCNTAKPAKLIRMWSIVKPESLTLSVKKWYGQIDPWTNQETNYSHGFVYATVAACWKTNNHYCLFGKSNTTGKTTVLGNKTCDAKWKGGTVSKYWFQPWLCVGCMSNITNKTGYLLKNDGVQATASLIPWATCNIGYTANRHGFCIGTSSHASHQPMDDYELAVAK